jgi:hypothetical protein
MITRCGLLPANQIRDTPRAYELYRDPHPHETYEHERPDPLQKSDFNVGITVLGCFDTVGSMGVPKRYDWFPPMHAMNERLRFHTKFLSPKIKLALHACAIDERRKAFDITRMLTREGAQTVLEQEWFSGDHGAIGGGDEKKALLANLSLEWMLSRIQAHGFGLNVDGALDRMATNPLLRFKPDGALLFRILGQHDRTIGKTDEISPSALERFLKLADYQPKTLICVLASSQGSHEDGKKPKAGPAVPREWPLSRVSVS